MSSPRFPGPVAIDSRGRVSRLPGGFVNELTRENELVQEGLSGQQGAPPGAGAEPVLVHQPGGDLLNGIQHPAFDTFERLFRTLPEASWFGPGVNPQRPIKFEFGSFQVPQSNFFLLMDYAFTPLRQSGADPFDFVYAEDGRFSGMMGFDITVSGRRVSNLFYQLDPAPASFARSAFTAGSPSGGHTRVSFDAAAANSFGSVSGEGTSLLPARPNVQGARGQPFTLMAGPNAVVSLSCVIFRRVMSPIAGIQATMSGFTMHSNTVHSLIERMRPR